MSRFKSLIFFFFTLLANRVLSVDVGCYVDGECVDSSSVGLASANTTEACYDICAASPDCGVFTQYNADTLCVLYGECATFSSETCSECVSAEIACPPLECEVEGKCSGNLLGYETLESSAYCAHRCGLSDLCTWWTFDSHIGLCTLYQDCTSLVECQTCVSGQSKCGGALPPAPPPPVDNILFATNGISGGTTEAIDLSGESSSCSELPSFPVDMSGGIMLREDGQPIACGGEGSSSQTILSECYKYDPEANQWAESYQLIGARRYAFAVELAEKETFWITGGVGPGSQILDTTEYFRDGAFTQGPALPFPLEWHCMALVSPTQVAILGGRPNTFFEDSAAFYLFDTETETYTEMPPMSSARGGLGCGAIQSGTGGGVELVAAGGYSDTEFKLTSSEIFSFESGEWRAGPPTPYYFDSGISLPYGNSFLIVGGDINHTILKFDVDTMEFVILEETLAHARYYGQAILVGAELGICPI